MDSLLELFCHVDDFCTASLEQLSARRPRGRRPGLCMSEIMTILIHFHQSNYRNFKAYYLEYVMTHLQVWSATTDLLSSSLQLSCRLMPAWAHAQASPSLTPPHLPCARIQYHKTFAGLARRGKTSTGTLIVNDRGELLDVVLTPGNVNPCPQAYSPSETRDTYRRDELWRSAVDHQHSR